MANRIMLNETSYHGAGAVKEIATEASGWSEVRFTYTVLDESGQNLFTVVLCNAVNLLKAWKSLLLCFVTQSFKLWIDVKKTHGSIISL